MDGGTFNRHLSKELKEGEVECRKCEGKGICNNIPKDNNFRGAASPAILGSCSKCNGSGKTDWVSNAMQKPDTGHFMFLDDYIDNAAQKLAEAIDKEILESIISDSKGGKIF